MNAFRIAFVATIGAVALAGVIQAAPPARAKNVILFIGDGMGPAQVQAAAFKKGGTDRDAAGNPSGLVFEKFPSFGYLTTFSSSGFVTDSSAAGTALASGHKTGNGMLGVDADDKPVENIAEMAKARGKAVGVVSSVGFNHATPACFYAHVGSRNDYDEITSQVFTAKNPPDVILGGGIYRKTWTDALLADAAAKSNFQIYTLDNLSDLLPARVGKSRVLGYFDANNNQQLDYATSRTAENREPRLAELTTRSLELIARNPKGFFLMVEGGSIDWACHGNMAGPAIGEVLELDAAIDSAVSFLRARRMLDDTLIIVTADHETGGMTLPGPYKGLLKPGQSPEVKFSSKGHTGIPVMVWSRGPGSDSLRGKNDNTAVFRTMAASLR